MSMGVPLTFHEEMTNKGLETVVQFIVIMTFGKGYCCKAVKLFHCTKKISVEMGLNDTEGNIPSLQRTWHPKVR